MGFLDIFSFKKSATFDDNADEQIKEISQNIALKNAALEKVANYVGRGISKAKFNIKDPNGSSDSHKDWVRLLNIMPNPNQTASEFLAEIGKSLIKNGEVLIVVIKSRLYIADAFTKETSSLDGHRYHVTTVQDITIDKVFDSSNSFLLKSENDKLTAFTDSLWTDYGELLGRLINRQKTANQIRFTLNMPKDRLREKAQDLADGGGSTTKSASQRFFDRVVSRIKSDSVVAIPLTESGAYAEYSNRYSSKASFVDDIKQVKNQYVDEVAEMVGLPTALIHGDTADNQKNHELAVEAVFEPIIQNLIDALTSAILTDEEIDNGFRITYIGLHKRDLFAIATPGDKLIAAGLATADEIREEIGFGPLPNGLGKKLYITKNYEELREKGGRLSEDNSS